VADCQPDSEYAVKVADEAYHWYKSAAIRARRLYRATEISTIVVSALVPMSAVTLQDNVVVPAILGSIVVIITGLRSIFHWHENYLRFSHAREAVEAERRKYRVGAPPYADHGTRDATLVEEVTRIEQDEMGRWLQLASAPSSKPNAAN